MGQAEDNVTEADLREALRTAKGSNELERVAQAYLERSGSVSFVLRRARVWQSCPLSLPRSKARSGE